MGSDLCASTSTSHRVSGKSVIRTERGDDFNRHFNAIATSAAEIIRERMVLEGRRGQGVRNTTGQVVNVNVDPRIVPYLSLWPVPGVGNTPLTETTDPGTVVISGFERRPVDDDTVTGKLDHHLGNEKAGNVAVTYSWNDGSRYDGEWQENKIKGMGTYTWLDGREYRGEWVDNNMDGIGVYTWQDGRKYEGEYKDDKKQGYGVYTW
mgnify:CR=1 FL=1